MLEVTGIASAAVSAPRWEYLAAVARWRRCRDTIAGSDVVKAAGQLYLPLLSGQDWREYAAYVERALFYGATARTVAGLSGAVQRKPATVSTPDNFSSRLADITDTGLNLDQFAKQALDEVLSVGRFGVLVDVAGDETPETERHPYAVAYATEQIINWQFTQRELTLLVIKEEIERPKNGSRFEVECVTQYRICELVDGAYIVTLAREDPRTHRIEADPPVVPTRRGQPLPFIPFVACGASALGLAIAKPPLLDLVDVNLSHYRSSADLEHGRHFTALPTAWISGMKPAQPGVKSQAMSIGSGSAWLLEDPQAKAGFLEFTGAGLGALVTALEHKEALMAVLGARLLESQPRLQETAAAVMLRHSGDDATLRTIATVVSQLLTQTLRWAAWWDGATDNINDEAIAIALNQDFVDAELGADQIKVLLLAVQAGTMSFDSFYFLLTRGEWTIPGRTAEQERHAIQTDEQYQPHDGTGQGA